MTENPPVEVTQADRDAAADALASIGSSAWHMSRARMIRAGQTDEHPFVQAFARRAQSAIAAFVADARKYPGYLREGVGEQDSAITRDWCLRMAEAEGDAEIGAGAPDHPLRCPPVEADAGLAGETDRDFENGFRAGVDFYICHPKATEREIDAAIIEELRSWKKWRRLTPTAATSAPDPLQPGRYPNTPLGEQQRPFGESFDGFKMLREHFAQPDALEPLRVGWVQLENGRFSISITKAELDAFRDALTAIAALSPRRDALVKFGRHLPNCDNEFGGCSCGFATAIRTLNEASPT